MYVDYSENVTSTGLMKVNNSMMVDSQCDYKVLVSLHITQYARSLWGANRRRYQLSVIIIIIIIIIFIAQLVTQHM